MPQATIHDLTAQARELRALGMHVAARRLEQEAAGLRSSDDRARRAREIIERAERRFGDVPATDRHDYVIGYLAAEVVRLGGGA